MSKPLRDNVSRSKSPSVLGRTLFVGLRTADLFWQHSVLARGIGLSILDALHGRTVDVSNVLDHSRSTGLQPYYQLILALAVGSCLKQNYHMLFISEQELSCGSALGISFFNTVFNTLNTILSLWVTTSQSPAVPSLMSMLKSPLLISTGFYVLGLVSELLSEVQRKRFKQDPANRGKPFSGGLFSLARNINYGAYTVWRTAYAFTAGGPVWSLITFAFFFHDFANRGVPVLEDYLLKRYGKQYEEVQRKVRYTLFPGIY